MPWVQKINGKIVQSFGSQQPTRGDLIYVSDMDGDWIAFMEPPQTPVAVDPVEKLRAFLAANPDVQAILE